MTPKNESTPEPRENPHDDHNSRPCIVTTCHGEADRIGEDTCGRPYWYCAECGTEFQTSE